VLQRPFISSFVPRFKRVCVVEFKQVGSKTYLVCVCGHFTRTGMPCRHLWHIKEKYWNEDSPRVIDFHQMWHSSYKVYAFATNENGTKLPTSPAVERSAVAFEKDIAGPTVLTHIPVLDKPIPDVGRPDFDILSAADRYGGWPKELIDELCNDSTFSEIPSMSQEVNIYTQDSDDDRLDWDGHFSNNPAALQSHKEDKGGVAGALIPLCKELMCSIEKASFLLPETCEQLQTMIARLNREEDGGKN
jgi:hypothetical protein